MRRSGIRFLPPALFNHRTKALVTVLAAAIITVVALLWLMSRLAISEISLSPQTEPAIASPSDAPMREANQSNLDEVVAVVNEEPITQRAWQQATRLDAVMSELAGQPVPTAEETLDRLINEIIVIDAISKTQQINKAEIETRLQLLETNWNVSDSAVVSALTEADLTRTDLIMRVARLMQVEAGLSQLAQQQEDLNVWLTQARASSEIGLYRSLVSQETETENQFEEVSEKQMPVESVLTDSSAPANPFATQPVFAPPPDMTIAPYPENAAPDFSLNQLEGETLSLSALRGRPVLINFWATWCPPCRRELPALQAAYAAHKDEMGFVAVNVKEDPATVSAMVEELGLDFPIALDTNGQISNIVYEVRGLPTTVFVDANGVVSARHIGPLDETTIDDYLKPLLETQTQENAVSVQPSAAPILQSSDSQPVQADNRAAPDFSLVAANGDTISLQQFRGKSNVALIFYRGHTWGICLNQLGQLAADLPQFQQKNTELIAIAVQDQAGAQVSANETGASFPILADPDHQIADEYGVYNLLGDGVATPAVFIIDKSGQITWSHIGQNVSDRPSNQTILENLPAE